VLIFFFLVIESRETNTQRKEPERGKNNNISLMETFVVVALCAP
jgi:hypothetical protein